jgi:hypothetical protein
MMRSLRSTWVFALAPLVLASPRAARAASDTGDSPSKAEPRSHVVVAVSPLPLLYGAYVAQVEWLVHPHVGLVLEASYTSWHVSEADNPANAATSPTITYDFSGIGLQPGVRLYFPRPLAPGGGAMFVAPSLIWGAYGSDRDDRHVAVRRIGAAVDFGGTYVARFGLALSVGVGLQAVSNSPEPFFPSGGDGALPSVQELAMGSGVRPRILLDVGWAF